MSGITIRYTYTGNEDINIHARITHKCVCSGTGAIMSSRNTVFVAFWNKTSKVPYDAQRSVAESKLKIPNGFNLLAAARIKKNNFPSKMGNCNLSPVKCLSRSPYGVRPSAQRWPSKHLATTRATQCKVHWAHSWVQQWMQPPVPHVHNGTLTQLCFGSCQMLLAFGPTKQQANITTSCQRLRCSQTRNDPTKPAAENNIRLCPILVSP
jgi:hypothetical protein